MLVRSILSSYFRLLTGALLAASAIALTGCNESTAEKVVPGRPVLVATVKYEAASPERSFVGTVKPRIESDMGFRVPGKVAKRLVEVGQTVEVGQPLALLDEVDLKLQAEQALGLLVDHGGDGGVRAAARPRRWQPPSGQSSAPMIPWIAWSALHHPLHEPVNLDPQVFAGVCTNAVSVMPPWPAERTPAPPALTFVLPGKQRVKTVRSGSDLTRAVRGLPQVCRVLGDCVASRKTRGPHYLCVRFTESAI